MRLEITENGITKEAPYLFEQNNLMVDLEELKNGFKDFVLNYKIVKYFGIDLVWQQIRYN